MNVDDAAGSGRPRPPAEPEAEKDVTPEEPPPAPEPTAPDHKVGEPPQAAEAGKVLTAEPDPDEPVDLTGQRLRDRHRRSLRGRNDCGCRHLARPRCGTPKQAGGARGRAASPAAAPAAAPPGKDADPPGRPTSRSWNCGFPPEADIDQDRLRRRHDQRHRRRRRPSEARQRDLGSRPRLWTAGEELRHAHAVQRRSRQRRPAPGQDDEPVPRAVHALILQRYGGNCQSPGGPNSPTMSPVWRP